MPTPVGCRPLYPEAPYEWTTHEAVISKDEAVIAIKAGAVRVDDPELGEIVTDTQHPIDNVRK